MKNNKTLRKAVRNSPDINLRIWRYAADGFLFNRRLLLTSVKNLLPSRLNLLFRKGFDYRIFLRSTFKYMIKVLLV